MAADFALTEQVAGQFLAYQMSRKDPKAGDPEAEARIAIVYAMSLAQAMRVHRTNWALDTDLITNYATALVAPPHYLD